MLDSENEDEVNVGPLLRYADPKKKTKCVGRELLDGATVEEATKAGKAGQFRFNLVWRDPETGRVASERQLYATSEKRRAIWVASLRDAIDTSQRAGVSRASSWETTLLKII